MAMLVRAARPDAQFVMIGEGPLAETLKASLLKAVAADNRVS